MVEILLDLLSIVALFFILKLIFKDKIEPYDHKFWSIIQSIWLVSSFAGVSFGLYEVHRVKEQSVYLEMEEKVIGEFEDIKIGIYQDTELIREDTAADTKPHIKESIQWFYKTANFMEESYTSKKWKRFADYSRRFIFNEPDVALQPNDNAIYFEWPQDRRLKGADIVYKTEIRHIINRLLTLQKDITAMEKKKPENKPEFFARYIFISFFSIAFALKLLRTYAEYLR